MTQQEIKAATKVVMFELGWGEGQSYNLAQKVLEAAEAERCKFMEKLFGEDKVS